MARVELKALNKHFGDYHATRDVDFTIEDGEFVVFVGPSGCGKSTLLRLIAGLEDISSGDLLFDGERVNAQPPATRGIGMVFQSYALYPHMTVAENIGFGLKLAKVDKAERRRRIADAARILQLDALLERKPKALSGGQRQRVAIGRAIVRNPRVFLFDEPLSNLDASLRVQMRIEIARLHRELNATMIYVTHDQIEAMTLADKIVVLEAGRVRQIGAPLDLYAHPANRFVAGFIGSPQMNFLNATVAAVSDLGVTATVYSRRTDEHIALTIPVRGASDAGHALTKGEAVVIGFRPEIAEVVGLDSVQASSAYPVERRDLEPKEAPMTARDSGLRRNERALFNHAPESPGAIPCDLLEVENLGNDRYLYLGLGSAEETVSVRQPPEAPLWSAGDVIGLKVDEACCHLFTAEGEALPRLDRPEHLA